MGKPIFTRILVANRGEIALRVLRACRELNITGIAVYGEGELDAPHVRYADESYRLTSDSALPYLDIDALIRAAVRSGAEAVHPGYGFLAENPAFARACADAGLTFIGPPPDAIAAMGDKVAAREVARQVGAPLVPGSEGPIDAETARAFGDAHGYPIALKAAAGGGGRGFRVAWGPDEVEDAYSGSSGEASRYFGDGRVYVERYLDHPRHIEIQVFADDHGNVVSLGERDCSIQRRHQKLIEESPSPVVGTDTRRRMGETAVALARQVGYRGAGTVEFLYQDGEFYFLEMNTRIQVEHPVTEMVTGIDLVAEQVRVAAGLPLSFSAEPEIRGHAIECRINAENPSAEFAPAPGTISVYQPPAGLGIRVDGAAEAGYEILQQYDSLIAKLIVWGRDRDEAMQRLARALSDFGVAGVPTTLPFHRAVVQHHAFRSGEFDTHFIERYPEIIDGLAVAPAGSSGGVAPINRITEDYVVEVGGKRFDVRLYTEETANHRRPPSVGARKGSSTAANRGDVVSPIQGTVLSVEIAEGAVITAGDLICVVEAMKMENEIVAPIDGVVDRLEIVSGQTVQTGALLASIKPADS